MGQWISEKELHAALIASPVVRDLQKTALVDVAAALVALASVEAAKQPGTGAMDVLSIGDAGTAFGLWQINNRVHEFNAAELPRLSYQIERAAKVWREVNGIVKQYVLPSIIAERRKDGLVFEIGRDVPHLYNVGWQYGTGGLKSWLATSNDWTPRGFAEHRTRIKKPVDGASALPYVTWRYARRAESFRTVFLRVSLESPSFWRDVVGATIDKATVSPGEIIEDGERVGAAGRDLAGKLPDVSTWFDGIRKAIKGVAVLAGLGALAVVVVLAMLVRWEIRRGRTFTRGTLEPAIKGRVAS